MCHHAGCHRLEDDGILRMDMSRAGGCLQVGAYRQGGVCEECVNAELSEMEASVMLRMWMASPMMWMKTVMLEQRLWLWWQQLRQPCQPDWTTV